MARKGAQSELNITPSVEERLTNLGFIPESFADEVESHRSKCDGNPSIYCGTYGKYNDGDLTGLWIDLTTFYCFEDFINFCNAIHADEEDPELDAQDWEHLPDGLDGDALFFEDNFEQFREYCDMIEQYDADAVDAYLSIFSLDKLSEFENRYQGEFPSEEAFAERLVDDCYDINRCMGSLASYFDYKPFARDLFMGDYTMVDNYVFGMH